MAYTVVQVMKYVNMRLDEVASEEVRLLIAHLSCQVCNSA